MLERLKAVIRGTINIERLKKDGLIVGSNFHAQDGVIIDPGHCWLITIGNNVTLAPRVHILAHDASTKTGLGYTKLGTVTIGNNVFIGAGSIILPGVSIPDNTIIGAGSVVTKKIINPGGVYVGSPIRYICSYEEYINRSKDRMKKMPIYDTSYIIGNITDVKKKQMRTEIEENNGGFIV